MRRISLALSLMVVLVAGCDEQKAPGGTSASSKPASSAPSSDTKPTAESSATQPASAKPELEEVKSEKIGFTLKVPKGTKADAEVAGTASYKWDTMIINVEPTTAELKSPDDLMTKAVDPADGKVDKKTEGDAFIVIIEKPSNPVHVFAGPKGAKLQSHCVAEPDHKDLAVEICSSLKSTK